MKKIASILICALLLASICAGCAKKNENAQTTVETQQKESEEEISAGDSESETEEETDMQTEDLVNDKTTNETTAYAGPACPSNNGKLHVDGTKLVDESGKEVQLRGVSTHGLAWFPDYVNSDCFATLKGWGANLIRLALYTHESGGYCTDGNQENLKQIVANGVQYATDNDMYVIIDWHVLNEGNPNTYKDSAKTFFTEMAQKYAGNNNVIYEICNEPCNGTTWSDIKSYASEIIPTIRGYDADAVILVGTPNWSQYVDEAAADPIQGCGNVMYTLHFYAATHKEDLQTKLINAEAAGLPIFVSEFGICDASGNGQIDEESANTWIDLLDSYDISYACWNLSNKAESSAILNSSCTKTSGFTFDDLSQEGQWYYNLLTDHASAEGAVAAGADPAQFAD